MPQIAFAREVPVPLTTRIGPLLSGSDLADAYAIRLPAGTARDPELLARRIFDAQPAWAATLMVARDALMRPFGIKTGREMRETRGIDHARVGIFRVYSKDLDEIILGEDDRHLDFRLSVMILDSDPSGEEDELIVSTVVHCHNALGRAYIAVITPFHRLIVRTLMERASALGWPKT